MLWKLHGNQFLKLSPNSNGFVAISHDMGNNFLAFPHDEVYHRMGITWEKSTPTMGEIWVSISQFPVSPHKMGFAAFSHAMGN